MTRVQTPPLGGLVPILALHCGIVAPAIDGLLDPHRVHASDP